MSLSRDNVQERIWKAVRRAQFSLDQRIQKIKWEESVLLPEIEALKAGKSPAPGLTDGIQLEFEVQSESHRTPAASDAE